MVKHLLIVEDNPYDLELARAALDLSDVRCQLSVAQDGQEALDLLRRSDSLPDLVLLDLNMPRVNGQQVLAAVKGDPVLREVPVVVFTTSNEQSDRAAATTAGADGYVLKPEGFSDLIATLNRLGRRWLTSPRCA